MDGQLPPKPDETNDGRAVQFTPAPIIVALAMLATRHWNRLLSFDNMLPWLRRLTAPAVFQLRYELQGRATVAVSRQTDGHDKKTPGGFVVIVGTFRYGRVDQLPGQFCVATQFAHFCFLPIIPLQSYVIQREEFEKFEGIPIPMSLKSVFLTWGRAILFLYVVTTLWGMWKQDAFTGAQMVWSGSAAVAFVLSLFYKPRASFARAVQLGLAVGIAPSEIAQQFGRDVPDTESLARLERELKPMTPEGKPGVGPAGKLFGGLLLLGPGIWLTYFGSTELLQSGRKGYGPSFWIGLVLLLGMSLSIVGLSCWIDWSSKTRNKLYFLALVLAMMAFAFGPTISGWWVGPPG